MANSVMKASWRKWHHGMYKQYIWQRISMKYGVYERKYGVKYGAASSAK
jgi:hypothetical protein